MASESKYRRSDDGEGIGTRSSECDASDIFKSFRATSNKALLDELRSELKGFQTSLSFGIFLLKIKWCNAKYSTSFSNAFCFVERQVDIETQDRVAYSFSSVFSRGCEMLESFLSDANYVPKTKGEEAALANLLSFLLDIQATSKALTYDSEDYDQAKVTETDWTIRIAHHVLSKLAVNPSYYLDKHFAFKKKECPCCNEPINGRYGDTSIGCTAGWHGYIDIVMEVQELPIKIAPEGPDSHRGNPSIESKTDDLINSRSQILAETIVFSFLQKRNHPEYDNFLIPTVGISRKSVGFYFYDCENDMLMETKSIPLLVNGELFKPTILALWLTINYRYFCSGITVGMQERNFTSDFHSQVEECIDMYQNHIQYACGSKDKDSSGIWEEMHVTLENRKPAKT